MESTATGRPLEGGDHQGRCRLPMHKARSDGSLRCSSARFSRLRSLPERTGSFASIERQLLAFETEPVCGVLTVVPRMPARWQLTFRCMKSIWRGGMIVALCRFSPESNRERQSRRRKVSARHSTQNPAYRLIRQFLFCSQWLVNRMFSVVTPV